jgi:serine/threonine protein kinase
MHELFARNPERVVRFEREAPAGYMSPEQAKGRAADKRSDVWAFGCVLFEMLSGRRAFEGEDITEILAAIVRGEPDWRLFPAAAPAAVRELVERCRREPQLILPASALAQNPVISPDGKWLAFQSTLSGRTEVHVQPFPGPGAPKQVSTAGGSQPLWQRDGRALAIASVTWCRLNDDDPGRPAGPLLDLRNHLRVCARPVFDAATLIRLDDTISNAQEQRRAAGH